MGPLGTNDVIWWHNVDFHAPKGPTHQVLYVAATCDSGVLDLTTQTKKKSLLCLEEVKNESASKEMHMHEHKPIKSDQIFHEN